MAGSPLSDPQWAAIAADKIVEVVAKVRDRTTVPVVHLTRALVFGLLALLLGVAVAALAVIGTVRAVQSLLELALGWPRAVYTSYLLLGGLLCLAGIVMMRRRHPR